jgi:hypothetical protein
MTTPQPSPIQNLEADVAPDTVRHTDQTEADQQPEYTGNMPEDPEEAVHYRPGEDDQK